MANKAFGITCKRENNHGDPVEIALVKADSAVGAMAKALLRIRGVDSIHCDELGEVGSDLFHERVSHWQLRKSTELSSAGVTKARLDRWI